MDNDLVAIQIDIAGRAYPLKVNAREKDQVQEIASNLNKRLQKFQTQFPRQEKVDYLSMALLTYATDLYHINNNNPESNLQETTPPIQETATTTSPLPSLSDEILGKLSDLETLLDKLLA
ncbi:MAG: cell division protein ZapA [Saprospiraceae bacterium]